jgi:iron complex outermembrane receptor protein
VALDEVVNNYGLQTELLGKFNTGSVEHQVLFGLDLSRDTDEFTFLRQRPFAPIDIFNPVYGAPRPTTFSSSEDFDRTVNGVGIYLQDQIALLPNLKLLAGGRFDLVDVDSRDVFNGELTTTGRQFDAFSPRVGVVYQPVEPISLYASFARSFTPNVFSVSAQGELLEPEIGTQYEVGIKGEFLDGRLSTTLAAYDVTKTNVATTDPNDIDFFIAAGEIKSRGLELDVAGEITPGWNVIASYAYTDAYVSQDNNLPVGDRLVNVPFNSASLWTNYEIQTGSLRGLGFGAGLYFVGDREATLPNSIDIPSYVRTDAAISYRRDNYKIALNIKNLLDVKYYDSQGFLIYPGAPLTFLGSFSIQF